jgi:hypothetical protein
MQDPINQLSNNPNENNPGGLPMDVVNASVLTPSDNYQSIVELKGQSVGGNATYNTPYDALKSITPTNPSSYVAPGQKTYREYFYAPYNTVSFNIDVPFAQIAATEPPVQGLPAYSVEYVSVNLKNTTGQDGVRLYIDKPKDGVGVVDLTGQQTIELQKYSKLSIVRKNPNSYNIKSIRIYNENGNLVKETSANTFDLPSIDSSYLIEIDTNEVVTPDMQPSIVSQLRQLYGWNIESNPTFKLNVGVTNSTTYVKYYFPNQTGADENGAKKVSVANGEAIITLNNPNAVGRYELIIFAGNEIFGDFGEIRTFIEVLREKTYGEPDVTKITFDRNITEADLRPLDFNFEFDLESVNSEGIQMYLGDNLINDIPVKNDTAKITLYAKDLYELYKDYFNETKETFAITFTFQPYFYGIDGKIIGKKESVSVLVKRAKFLISKSEAIGTIASVFSQLFSGGDTKQKYEDQIVFEDDKHLYYQVRTNANNSFVVSNIGIDNLTYSIFEGKVIETQFEVDPNTGSTRKKKGYLTYGSLVVKLLEPLPIDIDLNTQIWVSKQIIPSIVETIIITDEDVDKCLPLKPNFGTDIIDETGYQFFDEITASGSLTSTDIVNRYVSQSQFNLDNLNISYTSGSDKTQDYFLTFENFVNFGGAQTRLENFQYKLESIEAWEGKVTNDLILSSVSSSIALTTSASYDDKVKAIKNGFDGLEKTLYNNFSITSSIDTFFTTQISNAEIYDRTNKNYLVKHIPQHVQEDQGSLEYLTFLEMIGQHFDIVWSYINGINRVRKVENKATDGISDKLVYELLESFGWDPANPFNGSELWRHAFGLNKDGSTPTNTNALGNNVSSTYTNEEARNQLWRRILNNLPYLLKHKGTRKSINAILACYGVPSSLMSIVEFGGPSHTSAETSKYTYEDRSAVLNLDSNEYVSVPWISSSNAPESVQLRFKTSDKTNTQQIIRQISGSNYWKVSIIPSASTEIGDIKFELFSTKNQFDGTYLTTTPSSTSSLTLSKVPLFDNDFKFVTIQRNRITNGGLDYDRYTLYLKEAVDDRVILSKSSSLTLQVSSSNSLFVGSEYYTNLSWTGNGTILFGGSGSNGISGSIDEVRLWNSALSESIINSHTLNPDVIRGNDVYSSTDNLLVRLDFEYPKNLYVTSSIKNIAPNTGSYTSSADAHMNSSITSYPYHYDVYERIVTADIPSIGFVGRDKVRTEDIELVGNLSYKARATKKAFDRAPLDSNRLGLFFSPVKELNLDILKSLGAINIGDYIGDWGDEYGSDSYGDLVGLRNYYFQRTNLNFDEYIKLVKSIDKSLFDMLDQVIPVRANVSKGLLIEPSLLDRSKIKINKPIAENIYHSGSVVATTAQNIETELPYFTGSLDTNINKDLEAAVAFYSGNYAVDGVDEVSAEYQSLESEYTVVDLDSMSGEITYNSGSTMGGIEIIVDAGLKDSTIVAEYDLETSYQSAGNEPDSPFNLGFGLYGQKGAVDRTYFREDGTLVLTQRYNAYIITIRYSRNVPYRIPANGLSSSLYNTSKLGADDKIDVQKIYRYEKKLVLIDPVENNTFKTPTQHSFYADISTALGVFPYGKGVITAIEVFDGYTSGHYRYTKDTTRGLDNSFFEGSKQTSLTTLDGASPVEVFVTNPNRLKVAASGRGSGEPILEVD